MVSSMFKIQTSGRVNLIGEHTDHQQGFVLPIAIDAKITLYGILRDDNEILVYSDNYKENFSILISELNDFIPEPGIWFNFIVGTLLSFIEKVPISRGCTIIITANLPQGAGLSSSAALEIGLFTLFEQIYNSKFNPIEVVKRCWAVENNYIGVKCGIMDQYIVRFGEKNGALKINCKDLTYELAYLPSDITILILDTNIRHKLIDSPYNTRIQECKIALQKINQMGYNIANLSELQPNLIKELEKKLENPYFKRVKHVITENKRVQEFFEILKKKNEQKTMQKLGLLLYESHESLQYDFEASWDRADTIVLYAKKFFVNEIYGARMVGGGWGGSVLLLTDHNKMDEVMNKLKEWFFATFDEETTIFEFSSSVGTKFEKISEKDIPEGFKHLLMA